MAVVANRRSVMTLFSRPTDIHSHRTRLVLAEKNINIEIANIPGPDLPEDLMDLNPYHSVPTLVDRDLTLYDSRVIVEYLDERFPHPPLMPVDPVTRAQFRLALFRIETDWYSIAEEAENGGDGKLGSKARKMLRESIRELTMERRTLQEKLEAHLAEKSSSRSTQVLRERNAASCSLSS